MSGPKKDPKALFAALRAGDRGALARALTLVESTDPVDGTIAQELLEYCIPVSGASLRIGITGIPGVGKSSLIDPLGMDLVQKGHRVAVLAVDPSSSRSGGSILGDKTRMQQLGASPSAYIRPSPTGGTLGGVARRTQTSMLVCEAAGFDRILVETVGVGQNELAVDSMTDITVLLAVGGTGDGVEAHSPSLRMLETWIFRVNLFPSKDADGGKAKFLRCGGGGIDMVGVGSAKSQDLGMPLGDGFLKVVLEFEIFISRNFPQ